MHLGLDYQRSISAERAFVNSIYDLILEGFAVGAWQISGERACLSRKLRNGHSWLFRAAFSEIISFAVMRNWIDLLSMVNYGRDIIRL